MSKRIVIVGGVAGGASAAARLRRLSEDYEIIMLEKGEYISFANCGLPYYVGGVIPDKQSLLVQTPEAMGKRFHLDIRVLHEALRIHRQEKKIEVKDHVTDQTYELNYDVLVLSPGSVPFVPEVPGLEKDMLFTLKDIPDTYRVEEFISKHKPRTAIVVGGGFIGLEMVENLVKRGIQVHLVELSDHVIANIDPDMAAIVHEELRRFGVKLHLSAKIDRVEKDAAKSTAVLSDGSRIDTQMVLMSVGVRPRVDLAREAGIKIGNLGGIVVDEHMKTSDDSIYAVGDAVEVKDFVSGKPALIPLAGPASKQGRIAANNIHGMSDTYDGTQGSAIMKVFDLTVACCGNNEKKLKTNGVSYQKSFVHPASHASYYPDSKPIAIKLLFDDAGKILGATAIGQEGVDKRMDVIATAMRAGMTVFDLQKLELCYAPPYSSAKDPVNMAGYTASNILNGDVHVFHANEVEKIDFDKALLLDVRTEEEYGEGSIPNSQNLPLDSIRDRIAEIPKDKDIYVYCGIGLRGYIAARILTLSGFDPNRIFNLSGGLTTYKPYMKDRS